MLYCAIFFKVQGSFKCHFTTPDLQNETVLLVSPLRQVHRVQLLPTCGSTGAEEKTKGHQNQEKKPLHFTCNEFF